MLGQRWQTMIYLTQGRCYEALYDELKALEAYHRAIQIEPTAVVPRLAVAKMKLKTRPDESVDEIDVGLGFIPKDPALRIGRAGALLRKEAMKPPTRRSWSDFDRALEQAAEVAPGSAAVVLMMVDRLALQGKADESLLVLEKAAKALPRSATLATALADALTRRGEHTRAIEALDRASAKDAAGDQAALRIARARVLTAMNRGREAAPP